LLTELKFLLTVELYVLKKHIKEKTKQKWYYKFLPETVCEAFTLAEVLMTLLIIGIVASLTIPALINDTQDAELNTALKKVYAELSAATKQIIFDNGGTFKGILSSDNDNIGLRNVYAAHLSYIKSCDDARSEGCWHPLNTNGGIWKNLGGFPTDGYTIHSGFILNNGIFVNLVSINKACSNSSYYTKPAICAWIIVDVNGFKKPNITGKDIFYFYILTDRLAPWGTTDSDHHECDLSGLYCAATKLMQ